MTILDTLENNNNANLFTYWIENFDLNYVWIDLETKEVHTCSDYTCDKTEDLEKLALSFLN